MSERGKYAGIFIGSSAGGLAALSAIFSQLPEIFSLPIVVVQHRAKGNRDLLEEILAGKSALRIEQASEKEAIRAGCIYLAPPDYHLLIEEDMTFSLSSAEPVVHSRPSIDVLFESAALALGRRLVGVVLTGASPDGSKGITAIRRSGGLTVVQDPEEAEYAAMPRAAIATGNVDKILPVQGIAEFLRGLHA